MTIKNPKSANAKKSLQRNRNKTTGKSRKLSSKVPNSPVHSSPHHEEAEWLRLKCILPTLAHKPADAFSKEAIAMAAISHIRELEAEVLRRYTNSPAFLLLQNHHNMPDISHQHELNAHVTTTLATKPVPHHVFMSHLCEKLQEHQTSPEPTPELDVLHVTSPSSVSCECVTWSSPSPSSIMSETASDIWHPNTMATMSP